MNKDSCFSTSGTGCNNYIFGYIVDNFLLYIGKITKQLIISVGCDISLNLFCALSLKILRNEFFEFHIEVILNKLQGGIIIAHHKICVLTYDVDLTDFLLIKFVKQSIIVNLVFNSVISYDTLDFHGIVENEESAFKFQRTDLGHIQKSILDIA